MKVDVAYIYRKKVLFFALKIITYPYTCIKILKIKKNFAVNESNDNVLKE